MCSEFGVKRIGFKVQGLGFRFQVSGFRFQGFKFTAMLGENMEDERALLRKARVPGHSDSTLRI